MKVLLGLGNPGVSYEKTRHNAGFLFLDQLQQDYAFPNFKLEKKFHALISRGQLDEKEFLLAQPQTFMNLSGQAAATLIRFYRLLPEKDLVVIYDDLDLPFGEFKVTRVSPHGHNGVSNIIASLKQKDFLQLRLGTDGRAGERTISGMDYVLQPFSPAELMRLRQEIFPAALEKLRSWL
ncbi:MAG: aminoacyl-tRNA hydrolase [bacterium]|nr:aminoacyl-tRNA hydrolase [bacterium]